MRAPDVVQSDLEGARKNVARLAVELEESRREEFTSSAGLGSLRLSKVGYLNDGVDIYATRTNGVTDQFIGHFTARELRRLQAALSKYS